MFGTQFVRFGLMVLIFMRCPMIIAKLRRRYRGTPIRVDAQTIEFDVDRGRHRQVASVSVGVRLRDKVRFCIQPETGFDRFCKVFGLAEEWQTKDEAFDRDVFIICDDPILLRALSRSEPLREAVLELVGRPNRGRLRCSEGALWVELDPSADKALADEAIARDVAKRVLPALLRIRDLLQEIVVADWNSDRDIGLSRQAILLIISLVFGALGAIALWFFHDSLTAPRQIVFEAIWRLGVFMAVIGALLLVMAALLLLRGTSRLHWVLLDILLVGAPGIYLTAHAVAIKQNQYFDKGVGEERLIDIADKRVVSGRKGRHTYYIETRGWPDARADTEIKVDSDLYEQVHPPACLRVHWHRGAYGDPWVSEMTPLRSKCAAHQGPE